MSDHYDRYNGMENLLGTNLAQVGTDCISRQAAIDAQGGEEMNKQRKVVITTTYNEMGIIIDTKAEEVAQPNLQPSCNHLATDTISRQAAIDALRVAYWDDNIQSAKDDPCIVDAMTDWAIRQVKALPPAQPKSGQWILNRSGAYCCSECMEPCASYVMMKPRDKFCKMCGSRNEVTE